MNQKVINKINIFGVFYAIFALAVSNLVFSKTVYGLGFDSGLGLACSALLLVVAFLIFFVRNKFGGKINIAFFDSNTNRIIVSLAIALLLIIAGISFRYEAIVKGRYDLGGYMEISQVDGFSVNYFVHGAKMLYVNLLRAVFLAFGNRYIAALVFQTVCQICGLFLIYLAIRKYAGDISALIVLAFGCFSPVCIEASCTLGPSQVFFMIASLCMFILSCCLNFNKTSLILSSLAGFILGFLFYLDISCLALIVLSGLLLKNHKDNGNKKVKKSVVSNGRLFLFVILVSSFFIGVLFCLIIDIAAHGGKISSLVSDLVAIYTPKEFSLYEVFSDSDNIFGSITAFLMLIGVPVMLFKENNGGIILFISTLVLAVLTGFSMISDDMNGSMYVWFMFLVIAGNSVSLILFDGSYESLKEKNKLKSLVDSSGEENLHTVHKIESDVELLQNPLPVPEKKKKKKMEYDYFVPDESDYDL